MKSNGSCVVCMIATLGGCGPGSLQWACRASGLRLGQVTIPRARGPGFLLVVEGRHWQPGPPCWGGRYYHVRGILPADSSARCRGYNGHGQTTVPAVTGGWASLTPGNAHVRGMLLADNSALCWGQSSYGQTTVPAVTGGWKSLAAGWWHTCGVTKLNSTTLCWGRNDYGQTDVPKP